MNTRLLGAAVLIALAVLIVPMFFSSAPPAGDAGQGVSLAIPPAPDRDLKTRTMDLAPAMPGTAGAAAEDDTTVTRPPASPGGSSDRLATVDIASRKPPDVGTDEAPAQAPTPSAEPPASQPPASQPPASQPPQPVASGPTPAPAPTPAKPAASPPAPAPSDPGAAANGSYVLNLGAYANSSSARQLIRKVRALGYPATGETLSQGGQTLTRVTGGPFGTRTAAEAARLKITQSVSGAPAKLESRAQDQHGDAPAATANSRAGGWAVQVAAVSSQADANALRDKLRGAGFDGFVDSVHSGGRQLWRVRAGPQTRRADADKLRDQIKAKLHLDGVVVSVP